MVHLLFLSCASERNWDLLSGVCFFHQERHHAPASLIKCELNRESRQCVVWRGTRLADADLVGFGAYGSSSEQVAHALPSVSVAEDSTRCVSLLGLARGAACFSARRGVFGTIFRRATQEVAPFLHIFQALLRCATALCSGVFAEAPAGLLAIDAISRTAIPLQNPFSIGIHARIVSWTSKLPAIDARAGDDAQPTKVELRGVRLRVDDSSVVLPRAPSASISLDFVHIDAGICAMSYYAPGLCASARDVELFHGSPGRYTVGRGQDRITMVADDEDTVSMAMSSLTRMMRRRELGVAEIGRLEVGTESAVDRGKSTKSFLMALFEARDHHSVEGVDTFNACYGGTNAFFSTANWIEGSAWTGAYGVVVCSDPAVHPDPATLSGVGASSVSALVSPRAALVVRGQRATFIKHAWDFYRPVGWTSNDAIVDMTVATGQYEEAMLWCQDRLSRASASPDLFARFDRVAYHNNAPYHSKRNLRLMREKTYGTLAKAQHEAAFRRFAEHGTKIAAENATTYTCPLYASLLSFACASGPGLVDRHILCMAYGSGCAASLFGLHVASVPQHASGVLAGLASRRPVGVEDALLLVDAFEMTHGRFGFVPSREDG